ncbi:unnamed protein product [Musa acuminata subsp. malaccensis]|uniref:(wild Malaysian banana) hypothetical protein n=1 Tax=Musa acuminata subsp. malaccensis TaxID=214687 RepID=A0A804HZ79_MUSAM|nr:unnamed protein product [Musa acuminata subsp. malaccensis]
MVKGLQSQANEIQLISHGVILGLNLLLNLLVFLQ